MFIQNVIQVNVPFTLTFQAIALFVGTLRSAVRRAERPRRAADGSATRLRFPFCAATSAREAAAERALVAAMFHDVWFEAPLSFNILMLAMRGPRSGFEAGWNEVGALICGAGGGVGDAV